MIIYFLSKLHNPHCFAGQMLQSPIQVLTTVTLLNFVKNHSTCIAIKLFKAAFNSKAVEVIIIYSSSITIKVDTFFFFNYL